MGSPFDALYAALEEQKRKELEEEERRKREMAEALGPKDITGPDSALPPRDEQEIPAITSADQVQVKQDEGTPDIAGPSLNDRYNDWLGRRPKEEDFHPSTGRKILAGVLGALSGLGGNPARAGMITDMIANEKFNRARDEWSEEGKALGEVRPLEQSRLMGERWESRNRTTERGQDLRYDTADKDRTQRFRTEIDRHEAEMARIDVMGDESARKTAADQEDSRHNREIESINRRMASVAERNAATGEGNLAQRKVEETGRSERATGGQKLSPGQVIDLRRIIARDMATEYPDWYKIGYLVKSSDGKSIIPARFDPENMDWEDYTKFYNEYKRRLAEKGGY